MAWLVAVLLVSYVMLLLYYASQWHRQMAQPAWGSPAVSIIIPARNEADMLPYLLADIQAQEYEGAIEVIVVDDHSTDETAAIAAQFGAKVLPLAQYPPPPDGAFKKHAITTGIAASNHPWIVTTDADSRVGRLWLAHLMAGITPGVQLIVGPVVMAQGNGLLGAFQQWDMLGMQLFTGGAIQAAKPFMANGANLAFSRAAFDVVQGYKGTTHKASGDDVFLLQKIDRQYGAASIRYAKQQAALVTTQPVTRWSALWQQRLRWASKTAHMRRPAVVLLMGTAWLFHSVLAVLFLGTLIYPCWGLLFVMAFFIKALTEALLLRQLAKRWSLALPWRWLVVSQLVYITYVVLVGILGNFIPYRWKGRKAK